MELKRQGLALLLSEQNFAVTLEIADRAYILERGAVRYSGSGAELARDDGVWKSSLAV